MLRLYIAPLAMPAQDGRLAEILPPEWAGWPFGHDLYVAELYSLIQRVPGVRHVLDVRFGQRPLLPGEPLPRASSTGDGGNGAPALGQRMIEVPPDALLCLLESEVEVVSL
jgi:hypothetical protein